MKRVLVTALAWAAAAPAAAREYGTEVVITTIDELYDLEEDGDIEEEELDVLVGLYQRPVNINRVDRWVLYDLPGVTLSMADAIIGHRGSKGAFRVVEDLLDVPGFDEDLLEQVRPFVMIDISDTPGEEVPFLRGDAKIGSIWRRGFGTPEADIDTKFERETLPQGFLRASATGFDFFGAGVLATVTRSTQAFYDIGRGSFVSEGPAERFDAEHVYLYGGYGLFSGVLGSYEVGFGESLVFDTTDARQPNGWRENNKLSFDNETGRLSADSTLFGGAVSALGVVLPGGWLDATAFVSTQEKDLFQYDFNYYVDDNFGISGVCDTDGDCPAGYVCGAEARCRSTSIFNADDIQADDYFAETYKDAFRETLFGGNASYNLDERTRVGITAYTSQIDWQLAQEAKPHFGLGARYPGPGDAAEADRFGAYGADVRWGLGPVDLAGEYARTFAGGDGLFVRGVFSTTRKFEGTVSFRYYDRDFKNPHGRGEAAPDEVFGARARNESGGRVKLLFKPMSGLKLTTDLEMWRQISQPLFDGEGAVDYYELGSGPALKAEQRVQWKFTSRERLTFLFSFRDRDLNFGGRGEQYARSTLQSISDLPDFRRAPTDADLVDFADTDTFSAPVDTLIEECYDREGDHSRKICGRRFGRGERMRAQLGVSTERVPHLKIALSYSPVLEDSSKYNYRYGLQHRLRAKATLKDLWEGGKVIFSWASWFEDAREQDRNNPDFSQRSEPTIHTYLELKQDLYDKRFEIIGRYGLLNYIDEGGDRYEWYHLARLTFGARF